ncbi:phage tail tube protein [Mycoplasma sp. VS299A]|uniref:phage tail tube protein n=1 Tax=Mycoplasma sp. VS299A TaxID=3401690 RepID=UPI003AAB25B4
MLKTNNGNKLYIALYPTDSTTKENAQYTELKFITELKLNYSSKKEDRNYFHNAGETTSIITGKSTSLSVSVDYDSSDELHQYLIHLMTSAPYKCNNQFIKLELDGIKKATETSSKNQAVTNLLGKAVIQFKNGIPSGNVDELIKIQFDIIPQDDKWEYK